MTRGWWSFVFNHWGHGGAKGSESLWGIAQIGLDQTIELEEGLLVECDVVDFVGGSIRMIETEVNGMFGESLIMLFPGESLLLSGGFNPPLANDSSRAVVIKSRYSEDCSWHRD